MRVCDLTPGQKVVEFGGTNQHTFVASTVHPIWPTLLLVIWRMADGSWSHDALHHLQDVGEAIVETEGQYQRNLRAVLLGEKLD